MKFKRCPFCGAIHIWRPHLNIICQCGAKYYIHLNTWLNRNTGESMVGGYVQKEAET